MARWTDFSPARPSRSLRYPDSSSRRVHPSDPEHRLANRKTGRSNPARSSRPTRRRVMTTTWHRIIVAALFICSVAAEVRADQARPCEREMARAAQLHGIPLGILYAVGLTETGRRGALH